MTLTINFVLIIFLFQSFLVILLLTQNGYRIKHIYLNKDIVNDNKRFFEVNDLYKKIEVGVNNFNQHKEIFDNLDLLVLNIDDASLLNISLIKLPTDIPTIRNKKCEVFLPNLNKKYSIFNDKEMISFTGILSSLRPFIDYDAPFVPKVNLFEIILKGLFIAIFVNLLLYHKLKNRANNKINFDNFPFLNLLYLYFSFYKIFIKNLAEILDRGEGGNPLFSREHYNYIKTKDHKYISIGNLEHKFQENMKNVVKNLVEKDETKLAHDKKQFEYKLESVSQVFNNYTRDELSSKFFDKEVCIAPVLTVEEAIQFQKNLNKTINMTEQTNNKDKLNKLIQIESFLLPNLKEVIIVDFNPAIQTIDKLNYKLKPKF